MGKRKKHNNPIRTTRPNGGVRPDKSLGQNFLIDANQYEPIETIKPRIIGALVFIFG